MAKEIAAPKITSGAGFNFEEKVIAYYCTYLLSGRFPFGIENGVLEQIDMQVRVDGWLLDDMLLSLKTKNGQKRICFSIKSNQQFNGCKAPQEFVSLAWEQYLVANNAKFDKKQDGIGLITASLPNRTHLAIQEILKFSRTMPVDSMSFRISETKFTNECVRELFESFKCPEELSKLYSVTDDDVVNLLKTIYIVEFDFEEHISRDLDEALTFLSDILKSNSKDEGRSLWIRLIEIIVETKRAGYIDLAVILKRIREEFELLDFPSHKQDWELLNHHSKENIDVINDRIGSDIFITRDKDLTGLKEAVSQNQITFLTGASGTGKTVLSKNLCEEKTNAQEKVIWLDAEYLNRGILDDFQNSLRLKHPLNELLEKSTAIRPTLVIDKLDRVYENNAFRNVSIILKNLIMSGSDWHILILVQSDELNRILSGLFKNNLKLANYKHLEIENPSTKQYGILWKQYPELYGIILRNKSNALLLNPKILDIIVRNGSALSSINQPGGIGETDIIDWVWENHIRKGNNAEERSSFVMKLAEKQISQRNTQIPKGEFAIPDQSPLNSLRTDKICLVKDEKISFAHNLFSDWSLYRLLLSDSNRIKEILENKLVLPQWVRPLRYYFIRMIDKETSLQSWLQQYEEFKGNSLIQDIMLDSIIFSSNTLSILEKTWDELISKNRKVFNRLLNRFLFVATFPDPFYLLYALSNPTFSETELATFKRIPNYIYWFPMIRFLHNHLQEVISMDYLNIAKIIDSWLRDTQAKYLLRKEAGEIAITLAEQILGERLSHSLINEEIERLAYTCGLAACNEFPERVSEFALIACGRRDPTGKVLDVMERIKAEHKKLQGYSKHLKKTKRTDLPPSFFISHFGERKSKPWKQGPKRRPVSAFSKVCVSTGALVPLIVAIPSLAVEIYLSLSIEEKKNKTLLSNYEAKRENFGMSKLREWYPAFYLRGQFYFFLNSNLEYGIQLIVELVGFATDRWKENVKHKGARPFGISIRFSEKSKKFYGDKYIFYWHRSDGNPPYSIVSALMALEKWLYDNADNTEKLQKCIELLVNSTSSLAIIGVLSSFGKKYIHQFNNALFSIICTPEFQYWDNFFISQNEGRQYWGWNLRNGEVYLRLAREWNSMPHRRLKLNNIFLELILEDKDFNHRSSIIIKHLKRKLKTLTKLNVEEEFLIFLQNLIAQCDPNNWSLIENEDKSTYLQFNFSNEISESINKKAQAANNNLLLLSFPIKCSILLQGQESLPEKEIQGFYNNIEIFKSQIKPSIDESFVSISDSICGIIAVLYKLHYNWIISNPTADHNCRMYISSIFKTPPPTYQNLIETDVMDSHWFTFSSYVIPIFWAEDPDSTENRKNISLLASIPHYKTISLLIEQSWEQFDKIGGSFICLLHLIINISFIKGTYYRIDEETYNKLLKLQTSSFVEKKLQPFLPELTEVHKQFSNEKRSIAYNYSKTGHFDVEVLKAAFSFINKLDITKEPQLKLKTEVVDNFFGFLIESIKKHKNDDYAYPNDWEFWMFDSITTFIFQLGTVVRAQKYWKPILLLDGEIHHFITGFMHSFFIYGRYEQFLNSSFPVVWHDLLEYCLNSDQVKFESKWDTDIDDIWCSLLGIDENAIVLWDKSQMALLTNSHKYFELWAQRFLYRSKCMFRFLKFLMRLPQEKFVFDMLLLVREQIRNIKDDRTRDEYITSELGSLLLYLWGKNKEYLKAHTEVWEAFNDLLLYLNDKQHIGASELIDRMADER